MRHAKTTTIARTLRKRDTWSEKLLWSWLRDRRFSAYKFRRQHTFGPYILGFFCVEAFLDIELDGLQHGRPDKQKADAERDAWLEARGVKVLRFWNSRLRRERDAIRETVKRSGGNCRQGRRIRCRIIANRQQSRLTSNREVPDDISFPLTPALSLGEREDVPQVHCEA